MSALYAKPIVSLNTSTITSTIIIFTSSAASTTTTSTPPSATNVSEALTKEAMDIVVTKIISLLILTILSVLSGILPLRLLIHTPHLFTRNRNSVDCFLCGLRLFSGGIYMATCFLHLMPDTRDKVSSVMLNMGSKTTYAVPELLIMTGFYAVVFVEQIIQVLYIKVQESDIKRRIKKNNKARVKAEKDAKQIQVFRSTLDEDVTRPGNQGNGKTFSGDEEEDDFDDNVLIDEEDEVSFNETESDRKSLDSATEVKESLIEQGPVVNRGTALRNAHQTQAIGNHVRPTALHNHHPPQQQSNHTPAISYSEMSTQVLRTFSRPSTELVNTTAPPPITRSYQNSRPPMIHTQIQQQLPQNAVRENHQIINHQNNILNQQNIQNRSNDHTQRDTNQEQQPFIRSSPPPPPLLPRVPYNTVQQPPPLNTFRPIPPRDSPFPRLGNQYPIIPKSPDYDSDNLADTSSPENAGSAPLGSDGSNNVVGDTITKKSADAKGEKDVDSGVFSTRRECETSESEPRKFTTSREVSFDRISESSSALQEIQVKRVVDELSRIDASDRGHFRSIVYIMALSFHGIFEGMALGLQTMKSSIWSLCFAIVVHRCVLAFKLGMDLCRGDEKQGTTFLCIGTFTLISTLGIITGIVISSGASLYSDVTVPEAILQSLATGTIFYIVFFDILFKVLDGKNDLKRVSCSFVGFSMMAIVFAITRS